MTTRVPDSLRVQVRERAGARCEYCLIHEDDAFYPHQPDHIIAEKHGGATDADNLAWSCFLCNHYKGADIASIKNGVAAL
jgi:5-methylcytosine-specific restriction endonuclease McrA